MPQRNSGIVTYQDRSREYRGEWQTAEETIIVRWNGTEESAGVDPLDDSFESQARRMLGEMVEKAAKA